MSTLQVVARRTRTVMARNLVSIGLYPGQETVIETLAQMGEITPGEIATKLGVRPPTITKTIIRLEEQGFVTRSASEADGRRVQVQLTKSGKKALGRIAKARKKTNKHSLAGLKKKDRKLLGKLLARIDANLED